MAVSGVLNVPVYGLAADAPLIIEEAAETGEVFQADDFNAEEIQLAEPELQIEEVENLAEETENSATGTDIQPEETENSAAGTDMLPEEDENCVAEEISPEEGSTSDSGSEAAGEEGNTSDFGSEAAGEEEITQETLVIEEVLEVARDSVPEYASSETAETTAEAEEEVRASGPSWEIKGSVLTISGNGAIAEHAFYCHKDIEGMDQVTKVVIGEGITRIGNGAFWLRKGIQEVELPEGLEEIGKEAFYMCTGLKKIVFPESLTLIDEGAFYATGISGSLRIPPGVPQIKKDSFWGCGGIQERWSVLEQVNLTSGKPIL